MTPEERAHQIVSAAWPLHGTPQFGVALQLSIAIAIRETIEECAKVVESLLGGHVHAAAIRARVGKEEIK